MGAAGATFSMSNKQLLDSDLFDSVRWRTGTTLDWAAAAEQATCPAIRLDQEKHVHRMNILAQQASFRLLETGDKTYLLILCRACGGSWSTSFAGGNGSLGDSKDVRLFRHLTGSLHPFGWTPRRLQY